MLFLHHPHLGLAERPLWNPTERFLNGERKEALVASIA